MKGIFEKKENFGFSAKHIRGFRGFPPMFHPHCELLLVLRGKIDVTIDGKRMTLGAGTLSAVFPYVVHSYENAPDTEVLMLMFEPGIPSAFGAELLARKPISPYLTDCEAYVPLFRRAIALANEGGERQERLVIAYLSVIVGELLGRMETCPVEAVSENMVKPILLYCSEHFADPDVSIRKIADALYISKRTVDKHRANILEKSGCKNTASLVVYAIKHGIVEI